VVPSLLGWIGGKLDTTKDILEIRTSVQALTNQQAALVKKIDEGLPAVNAKAVGLQRDVVIATGVGLAFETEKISRLKLVAAEDLARSYDGSSRAGHGCSRRSERRYPQRGGAPCGSVTRWCV
jgi:hypothetical protein